MPGFWSNTGERKEKEKEKEKCNLAPFWGLGGLNPPQVVASQSDTVWFGEVDYQAMAAGQGTAIGPATLLLFGGPAPGGVAMAAFPSIGLDAFCQKLLVYRDDKGSVQVLFNSIVALAELHYGRSVDPHRMLDQRLTGTFKKAIAPQGAP